LHVHAAHAHADAGGDFDEPQAQGRAQWLAGGLVVPRWGFVVDEIDRYCSASHADPNLRWIIDYGRGQRISLIGLARRAARVSRDLSANADWIVAFQTQEPRDLDYLQDFGFNTEGLADLEPFHWRSAGNVADLQNARTEVAP